MARQKAGKHPQTPALRALRAAKIAFDVHLYDYVPRGGTTASSQALGVDEHQVVKTLVFDDGSGHHALVVLMHGDCEVSAKGLSRTLGRKQLAPSKPTHAEKWTGYRVGGTSPFGMRTALPVYVEQTIFDLERIWINGGRRGLLIAMHPQDLRNLLQPTVVHVARSKR